MPTAKIAGSDQADEEDALLAPDVARLARRRPDDAKGEQRAGDDPRERRLGRVEVGAMVGSETARTVIVKPTVNSPNSAVPSTNQG
jgi:hypothetical protein